METKLEATMREDKKKTDTIMAKITQKWVRLCLRHKKIDSAAGKKSLRMAVTEELTYDPIALL